MRILGGGEGRGRRKLVGLLIRGPTMEVLEWESWAGKPQRWEAVVRDWDGGNQEVRADVVLVMTR